MNKVNLSGCKTVIFSGLAAIFLSACGHDQGEPSELTIYGGTKVNQGEWRSAVSLTSRGRSYCSATIVHPRLVITAAHCLGPDATQIGIYLGEGTEGGRFQAQYFGSRGAASPLFRGLNNDIAYIVTAEAMDIDKAEILPILADPEEIEEIVKVGNEVHLVGFGKRENGYGVKYEVDAAITSFNSNEVSIGGRGKDSCSGDSGGPAYGQLANGEWRVFGIVSRGGRCGSGGIWGRMSDNVCWVQQNSGIDLNLPLGTCS